MTAAIVVETRDIFTDRENTGIRFVADKTGKAARIVKAEIAIAVDGDAPPRTIDVLDAQCTIVDSATADAAAASGTAFILDTGAIRAAVNVGCAERARHRSRYADGAMAVTHTTTMYSKAVDAAAQAEVALLPGGRAYYPVAAQIRWRTVAVASIAVQAVSIVTGFAELHLHDAIAALFELTALIATIARPGCTVITTFERAACGTVSTGPERAVSITPITTVKRLCSIVTLFTKRAVDNAIAAVGKARIHSGRNARGLDDQQIDNLMKQVTAGKSAVRRQIRCRIIDIGI